MYFLMTLFLYILCFIHLAYTLIDYRSSLKNVELQPVTPLLKHDGISTKPPITDFSLVVPIIRSNLISRFGEKSGELKQFEQLLMDLDNISPPLQNFTRITLRIPPGDSGTDLEKLASNLFHIGLMKIKKQQQLLLDANWPQRFSEIEKSGPQEDVPCHTDVECARLNKLINSCNTAREQCYNLYAIYNQITNVLNQIISVLCACIFVGPVEICALKQFPYTCVFPYQAFSTFSTGSSSVWEAVKTLSSLCRFHTDPRLMPKIA